MLLSFKEYVESFSIRLPARLCQKRMPITKVVAAHLVTRLNCPISLRMTPLLTHDMIQLPKGVGLNALRPFKCPSSDLRAASLRN